MTLKHPPHHGSGATKLRELQARDLQKEPAQKPWFPDVSTDYGGELGRKVEMRRGNQNKKKKNKQEIKI